MKGGELNKNLQYFLGFIIFAIVILISYFTLFYKQNSSMFDKH